MIKQAANIGMNIGIDGHVHIALAFSYKSEYLVSDAVVLCPATACNKPQL